MAATLMAVTDLPAEIDESLTHWTKLTELSVKLPRDTQRWTNRRILTQDGWLLGESSVIITTDDARLRGGRGAHISTWGLFTPKGTFVGVPSTKYSKDEDLVIANLHYEPDIAHLNKLLALFGMRVDKAEGFRRPRSRAIPRPRTLMTDASGNVFDVGHESFVRISRKGEVYGSP